MGTVIWVALVFAVILGATIWVAGSFAAKQPPPAEAFDLRELRHDLEEVQIKAPEIYRAELEPFLSGLEAKYGNIVPMAEMDGLQKLIASKLAGIEERKQEIINQGASEGKTIEIESLRQRPEVAKASYSGPNRDAYTTEVDYLLDVLSVKIRQPYPGRSSVQDNETL